MNNNELKKTLCTALLLIPVLLIAQERRLSVNWVTGIAGNYSWDRLNRPTLQTSWRMVQGYNGHDSMFGWDNWGIKGEYSYCRTDYHRNQNDYWMVTFDYYVNNTSGCGYGAAIEGIWYTQDSGKNWVKQEINLTPDTMVYYQSKSGERNTCWCPFELNCWDNSITWHRFTFVFFGGKWTAVRFTFDYEDYTGKGRNYTVPLSGFWIRDFNMERLDSGLYSDGIALGFEPKKPRFKQVYIEQEPEYQLYDLIGRKVKFNGAGMYVIWNTQQ